MLPSGSTVQYVSGSGNSVAIRIPVWSRPSNPVWIVSTSSQHSLTTKTRGSWLFSATRKSCGLSPRMRSTLQTDPGRLRLQSTIDSCIASAGGPEPDTKELLARVDDMLRGDSSRGTMTMRVKTRRFERNLTMEIWSKGTERSLIRITAPAKEKGTATLKVEDQIWNYLPKVDRTIKVPASMMSGSLDGQPLSRTTIW